MAGRDEHVTGLEVVAPVVAEAADARIRQCGAERSVPLLHEHTRRNEHEDEAAASQRVGRGRDRDFGLARAGDRFDDPPAPAAHPRNERVELPSVQVATR